MSEPKAESLGSRVFPHPFLTLVLALVWLLLVNSVHPRMILLGVVFGVAIPMFTRPFWPDRPHVKSWSRLIRFVPRFFWDVLIANVQVFFVTMSFWRKPRATWIVVPLEITNPYAITSLANVITLTPGTVSAEIGHDRKTLVVHCLDAADPDATVAYIKKTYEAALKEIFE
jgi:multicomponent K+:H+ antiporter subunit E